MKITDTYDGSTQTEGTHRMAIKNISAARRKELLSLDDGMAERIKVIMEKQGILDRDLARGLDVADRTIYNWKTTGQVSRKLLPLLAEFLSTTTEFLVTGVEPDRLERRRDDLNVVQMERPLTLNEDRASGLPDGPTSLITRYVGIYEMTDLIDGVQENPTKFRDSLHEFTRRPETRTSLAITLNPKQLEMPGIPRFAFQLMVDYFPEFYPGTYLAYAPDLVPERGSLCCIAYRLKGEESWAWGNGHLFSRGQRMLTNNLGEHFFNLTEFTLKTDPDRSNDDDVFITPDHEWELIGTCTYAARWLDNAHLNKNTGWPHRVQTIYEKRRNPKFTC